MKCVNCGKDSDQFVDLGFGGFKICQTCTHAQERLTESLKDGIEVEYSDGSTETIKSQS